MFDGVLERVWFSVAGCGGSFLDMFFFVVCFDFLLFEI